MKRLKNLFLVLWPWLLVYGILCWILPPWLLFNQTPTVGGDLGSQGAALYLWLKQIFPHFSGWTFSWYFGMPLMAFYFPIPFYIAAILAKIFGGAIGFKLAYMGGVWLAPFCFYFFAKKAKLPMPQTAVLFSLLPLFLKSNTIVGGSVQSVFCGEWTHMWSLNFLLLFLGFALAREKWWLAGIFLAFSLSSHILTLPFIAMAILAMLILEKGKNWLYLLLACLLAGAILSPWLIPFVRYHQFSAITGYGGGQELYRYLYQDIIIPIAAALALIQNYKQKWVWFLLVMTLWPLALWQFFPQNYGIWLARFFGYFYWFLFLLASQCWLFQKFTKINYALGSLIVLIFFFAGLLTSSNGDLTMNYKYAVHAPKYSDATYRLIDDLNKKYLPADLSAEDSAKAGVLAKAGPPRLINEYNDSVNNFHSPRGFEMLPMYAPIDYVGGLYVESALSAGTFFTLQAEISEAKYQVGNYFPALVNLNNLSAEDAYDDLKFMGVKYLVANKMASFFEGEPANFKLLEKYDEDTVLFEVIDTDLIVSPVLTQPVVLASQLTQHQRQDIGLKWLVENQEIPLIFGQGDSSWATIQNYDEIKNMAPQSITGAEDVKVEYKIDKDKIVIKTNKPGLPLWVKVSYFPTWQAEGGKLYYAAPSVMIVVPEKEEVVLKI